MSGAIKVQNPRNNNDLLLSFEFRLHEKILAEKVDYKPYREGKLQKNTAMWSGKEKLDKKNRSPTNIKKCNRKFIQEKYFQSKKLNWKNTNSNGLLNVLIKMTA